MATTTITESVLTIRLKSDQILTSSLMASTITTSTITSDLFIGNGRELSNISPNSIFGTFPSGRYGFRTIPYDAIIPFGDLRWKNGNIVFQKGAPVLIQSSLIVQDKIYADGSQIYNINAISTTQLISTVEGLHQLGYLRAQDLANEGIQFFIQGGIAAGFASTVSGLPRSGFVLATDISSTIRGLGTLGYVSTSALDRSISSFSTALGFVSGEVTVQVLQSSLNGLGTLGYTSTSAVQIMISSFSTALGFVSGEITIPSLRSTLVSTVGGLHKSGYINKYFLRSTVQGIEETMDGRLVSSVFGIETVIANSIDTGLGTTINSSLRGLGSLGYISSAALLSTTRGIERYIDSMIDPRELASTVAGLGTLSFVSTSGLQSSFQAIQQNIFSSVTGLGTIGYVSTSQLRSTTIAFEYMTMSTVEGLGSSRYISSSQLTSSIDSVLKSSAAGLSSLSTLLQPPQFFSSITVSTGILFLGSGNIRTSSSLLFYNELIIGGTRTALGQEITL